MFFNCKLIYYVYELQIISTFMPFKGLILLFCLFFV